jgi:fructose/tagatose bisphosphate aldolase
VSDLTTLKAVFEAARVLNVPVLVGVSEGEREFMGVRQVAALIESIRQEYNYPIFLNADHTHSLRGSPKYNFVVKLRNGLTSSELTRSRKLRMFF